MAIVNPFLPDPKAPKTPEHKERIKERAEIRASKATKEKRIGPHEVHVFPRSLPAIISTVQPDITGAILLYGINLWTKNNYRQTNILGERYGFRSLGQLAGDHPYLTKSGIEKALLRLEVKKLITIKRDKKVLWYSVPKEVERKCSVKKELIRFRVENAVQYGLNEAILLANLQWQYDKVSVFITDADRNTYYRLGSTILAEHLPMSRWTVTNALKHLVAVGAIAAHPAEKNYYAFTSRLTLQPSPEKGNGEVFDRDGEEVDANGEEVDDPIWTDSNKILTEDRNSIKSNALPLASPAAGHCSFPVRSEGLINLLKFANEMVTKQAEGSKASKPIATVARVHEDTTPYDDFTEATLIDDLPYDDFTGASRDQDLPYDVHSDERWRDDVMSKLSEVYTLCLIEKIPFKKIDFVRLLQLFIDNTHLDGEDISTALLTCLIIQNPPPPGVLLGVSILDWNEDDPPRATETFDPFLFPKKVKSLGYFLDKLPMILVQLGATIDEDSPYRNLNYAYLGKPIWNKMVRFDVNRLMEDGMGHERPLDFQASDYSARFMKAHDPNVLFKEFAIESNGHFLMGL